MADMFGLREMLAAMRRQQEQVDAATRATIVRGGHVIEAKIKLRLTTSSHQRGTPTPSRPGEPPSLITGTLRRSIAVDGPTGTPSRLEVRVGPRIVYGRIQELGGIAGRGSRLPARPYVEPGLDDARDQVQRMFREAWDQALS